MSRRAFVARAAVGLASVGSGIALSGVTARSAHAMKMSDRDMSNRALANHDIMMASHAMNDQDATQPARASAGVINMDGDYYKAVHRPPKANAKPQLDDKQMEELERKLACPCPCTLDVFTCRTTDFTCGNSPAVHRDVQALVAGGYSADEIMNAMLDTYGEFILMAPTKKGFNLLAWFAPFAALGTGAVVISVILRGWRRNAQVAARAASTGARLPDIGASEQEMARLEAALRDDER